VPVLPVPHHFTYVSYLGKKFPISRLQLPLLPAYSYTDYKSQGRTLSHAVVDLASAKNLQGVYVMLSCVKTLDGLAVLRPFEPKKIKQRLSQELRTELECLNILDEQMRLHYQMISRDDHTNDPFEADAIVQ
jgi:hypothetical protein